MSNNSLEIFCILFSCLCETNLKFMLPATHICKLFGKKERIVAGSRSIGTQGSYGINPFLEAVVNRIDNFT